MNKMIRLLISNKPAVLMFHRVLPGELITNNNGYTATDTLISTKYFEKVLRYLIKRKYSFVTVSELQNIKDSKKYVALTFDDGYSDNFEYAYPLLKKYNITATFFPSVKPCKESIVLPLDIYYHIIEDLDFADDKRREYYTGNIKKEFYWEDPEKQNELLKKMFSQFPERANVSYMTAEQLRLLSDEGFEIGSHGMTHSLITADYMNEQKVVEELKYSKQWLEEVTEKPVVSFCFPAGRFNLRMIELAGKSGYRSTCIISGDIKGNPAIPSYKRVNVKQDSINELKNVLEIYGRIKTALRYRLGTL
jgi:peptidoglycan/xylan/chitin deacetylase (PgdA/CDA1 family)